MTPMIVRATPWLRCGVNPSSSMRSRTCWITSGVGCGFNTMIIAGLSSGPSCAATHDTVQKGLKPECGGSESGGFR